MERHPAHLQEVPKHGFCWNGFKLKKMKDISGERSPWFCPSYSL
ncbi:hypothetical protein B4098_2285 [Heyndrickxia coagulans]|uniref:Uncharacterized protein n=1 Tax=Heyndrickxia coagulans TaxID=1398 RepID=A0A150KCS3_HEYCO|nr:hypothetical protein B4098_2285 [Heyndrickxia coagulans]